MKGQEIGKAALEHLKNNKKAYIAGGLVAAGTGAAGYTLKKKKSA